MANYKGLENLSVKGNKPATSGNWKTDMTKQMPVLKKEPEK